MEVKYFIGSTSDRVCSCKRRTANKNDDFGISEVVDAVEGEVYLMSMKC